MDHLPFPHGIEPPTVPFVGTLCDKSSDTLRRRMKDDISACSFIRLLPEEYQAFFQTRLYFECLTEMSNAINLPIDTARFVQRTSDGVSIVTSVGLNEYLDRWRDRETAHPRRRKATSKQQKRLKEEYKRLHEILGTMRKMLMGPLQEFHRFLANYHPSSPVASSWPNIALSIAALGYTFQQVSKSIYGSLADSGWQDWGVKWVLRERLQGSHWCRALITKFLAEECIDFVLFVGSTPFPRQFEDHDPCTDTICCGRIPSENAYETSHVVKGCACRVGEMPSSAAAIVDRGGVPLATWSDEGGLEVVEYKPNMPYVAISHVWSDGKGNPKRNALPECQLKSIQDKVEALYAAPRADPPTTVPLFGPWTRHGPRDPHRQPQGFWMDTLCIPVGESEAQVRCKRKAIGQMRKIYEDADRVLVLDDRIQQLSMSSPFCDRAISLIVSNWQSRIWTLQEGVMAQQLFIQFSDGVFTLIELQDEEGRRQSRPSRGLRHGSSPTFWHRVTTGLLTLLSIGLRFDPEEEESGTFAPDALFGALIPVAKRRLTSRREDETICLSTLLRLDLGPLLDIRWNFTGKELRAMPEEQRLAEETRVWEGRMKRFLCMIGCFDKLIIFNALPRLSENGFRWAPSSFLGQSGASSFVDHEWFHQITSPLEGRAPILFRNKSGSSKDLRQPDNALGFMVTFPGIMLHTVSRSQIEAGTFYVREKRFRRFLYYVTLKDSSHLIDLEHSTNQYALITLGAATLDRNGAIPAVFGVFLGMVDKRVRKLRHLSVARVTVIDRRHEMAKEKAKYVQVHKDELEEGEAWVDEDSDNWNSTKDEESEDDSEDDSEDLGYALSDRESGGDSENGWGGGKGSEVEANSGSDGDHDQEIDDDSDDKEDNGEDGGHVDNITGTNGKIDRNPPLEQIVYGKVLLTDNNKWCVM